MSVSVANLHLIPKLMFFSLFSIAGNFHNFVDAFCAAIPIKLMSKSFTALINCESNKISLEQAGAHKQVLPVELTNIDTNTIVP